MEFNVDLSDVPGVPVLVGVGGSHAYGLATDQSDVDYRGCYVAPTRQFFGLERPPETYDRHDPDMALHEVAKLFRLALGANPTVLELFYYDTYVVQNAVGKLIVFRRDLFISEKIRATHAGFATSQLNRLMRREDDGTLSTKDPKKIAKHARHLLRLIQQAERALTTGVFDIKVADRDEIFAFGELPFNKMVAEGEAAIERLKTAPCVLPPEPYAEEANDLLVGIREAALSWG